MEEKQAITASDPRELTKQALALPERAKQMVVENDQSYRAAGDTLLEIQGLRKLADATFDPIIAKAKAATEEAKAQKSQIVTPLIIAERSIKKLLSDYDDLMEAKRKKEEEDAALLKKEAEDSQLNEAVAAEEAGDHKAAEAILKKPVTTSVPVVKKETPKVKGISFSTHWKFNIVDENAIPREFLMPDMVKIGKTVREHKEKTDIPGIEAYPDKRTAVGKGIR